MPCRIAGVVVGAPGFETDAFSENPSFIGIFHHPFRSVPFLFHDLFACVRLEPAHAWPREPLPLRSALRLAAAARTVVHVETALAFGTTLHLTSPVLFHQRHRRRSAKQVQGRYRPRRSPAHSRCVLAVEWDTRSRTHERRPGPPRASLGPIPAHLRSQSSNSPSHFSSAAFRRSLTGRMSRAIATADLFL